MNFKEQLKDYIELVNTRLSSYLDYENGYNSTLIESMKYSLFTAVKTQTCLAQLLMTCSGTISVSYPMLAHWKIHTYSLIHDDLRHG